MIRVGIVSLAPNYCFEDNAAYYLLIMDIIMAQHTALYDQHLEAGAKMVDFAGWEMPIHYGSQLQEHHTVRQDAGVFDVSHMCVVDILGPGARDFLRFLLANDVDKMKSRGRALYSCMLNDRAGVVDDLIIYFLDVNKYRVVLNASRRAQDLEWMNQQAEGFSVGLHARTDLSMAAIQGPNAIKKVSSILPLADLDLASTLQPFDCAENEHIFIARTGYTGEDGFEIIMHSEDIEKFWDKLLRAGVRPAGLGARDTLRLEAGMNLYGNDMDESTNPLESMLGWTIAWEPKERLFLGRAALELIQAQSASQKLVGLILEGKGIMRQHQKVIIDNIGEGEVTSGGFSPTLNKSIAFARVPVETGTHCFVKIRGKKIPARIVKPPFVRKGDVLIKL